jgi:hypothetical protein
MFSADPGGGTAEEAQTTLAIATLPAGMASYDFRIDWKYIRHLRAPKRAYASSVGARRSLSGQTRHRHRISASTESSGAVAAAMSAGASSRSGVASALTLRAPRGGGV